MLPEPHTVKGSQFGEDGCPRSLRGFLNGTRFLAANKEPVSFVHVGFDHLGNSWESAYAASGVGLFAGLAPDGDRSSKPPARPRVPTVSQNSHRKPSQP